MKKQSGHTVRPLHSHCKKRVTVPESMCQSVTVPECHCVKVSMCQRVTVPESLCQSRCVKGSLCHRHCVKMSLCQSHCVIDTVSKCHCARVTLNTVAPPSVCGGTAAWVLHMLSKAVTHWNKDIVIHHHDNNNNNDDNNILWLSWHLQQSHAPFSHLHSSSQSQPKAELNSAFLVKEDKLSACSQPCLHTCLQWEYPRLVSVNMMRSIVYYLEREREGGRESE
ncbi:hypothetical protein JZ751_028507 [Albula glossodonta]|uniref:Uncharacterized protein n=1 Tax=Albula glossodonta TaxID=121402 RepID=A0A8T2MQV7_9TELE|nr:hypothetical protein JZ751_028507 [Albula glossodonta]